MAINIGANNMGPAVGANALTMGGSMLIAAVVSVALWVNLATWVGAPVSTNHIAVGGVFGVGFFREWHMERRLRNNFGNGNPEVARPLPEERRRRKLVRRSHFITIVAAWVITVPTAAAMSAMIFLVLNTLL